MSMDSKALEVLVAQHQRFLSFLTPRVGSPVDAEELLQAAFVKSLEKGDSLREGESAVAWFYRLLGNTLVDYYRHRGVESRALERHAREAELSVEEAAALQGEVCACVLTLAGTLKPDYLAILRAVDLEGAAVTHFAQQVGITANNAMVRLHRARAALRKRLEEACGTCCRHGCLDCPCGGV